MRISVYNSRELQAVLLGIRAFDREARRNLRRETKAIAQTAWQKALAEHSETRLEALVLSKTGRVAVSDQNVTLQSARVGRSLAGGLKPSESWHAVEFGGDQNATETYEARSKTGKTFSVTRHTRRQLRPRKKAGYVVYPALAEMIPRIASLWVQTFVRTFYEALEQK